MAENENKRRADDTTNEKLDEILQTILSHADDELHQINDLRQTIKDYFGELDAHIHKVHHSYIAKEVDEEIANTNWWSDVRKNIITAVVLATIVGILGYIGGAMYSDMQIRMQQEARKVYNGNTETAPIHRPDDRQTVQH